MDRPNKNRNFWHSALIATILIGGSTHISLQGAFVAHAPAGADEPGFFETAFRKIGDAVDATGKAIGRGIEKLNRDEADNIVTLIGVAITRYEHNIALLEAAKITGGVINLQSLAPQFNGSDTTLIYNSGNTLSLREALTERDLSMNRDFKKYFSTSDKQTPRFDPDSISVNTSSSDSSYYSYSNGAPSMECQELLGLLISKFREEARGLQNALLKRSLQQSSKVGTGDVLKAMVERDAQITSAKESALINATTAADQSEKNLKNVLNFLQNPRTAAILLGTFGGGVALYHLLPRLIAPKPQIVSEMSFLSPRERIMGKKLPQSNFDQIVFTAETGPQIMRAVSHMRRVISKGGELMNLIFFGPPGTGKTMSAKAIARSVGADYMLINASAFEQLTPGQAVSELEAVFRLARQNKKPVIIFLDEADAVMGRRGNGLETHTSRRVINTFLANVADTHNSKIMFIIATNLPSSLDKAVLSRFPEEGWIFFDRPSQSERARILRMYLESFCLKDGIALDESAKENMEQYATQLKGKTGRDLRAIARSITDRMVDAGNATVTDGLIRETLSEIERNKKNMDTYLYDNPTAITT